MVGLMKTSSNDLSTYRRSLAEIGFDSWFNRLTDKSEIVARGGALLPTQLLLLNRIFQYFAADKRSVLFLSAAPASGKTHVICLVSVDLATFGLNTAIVVPSSELRHDFNEGFRNISNLPKSGIDILTMQAFLREREHYDVALLDEAHNIRSSFELNRTTYRVLDISDLTPRLNWMIYDSKSRKRALTKVIEGEQKESLLKIVHTARGYKWLKNIYLSRSKWIVTISHVPTKTELHLLSADPHERLVTARSSTILISATPLNDDELELYCGIQPADVCRLQIPSQTNSASRCRYFAPRERIDSESAIALAHKLLAKRPVRTLILVNRPVTLRRWLQGFQDAAFDSRVIGILGGDGSRKRLEKFSEFMSRKDSILLTNSTVFWEGINIKQLRILIITEEPNPRPNLVDLYNGRSRKFSHIVRNRMTQGMGRIGREPGTDAICLILFPYKDARVTQFDCSSASVEKTVQLLREID
jgi:hypothetical protein